MRGRQIPILLALAGAAGASAQPASTSPAPESVSVSIYRDPHRPAQVPMRLRWLNGYALISETRRVSIPAGEGDIRFEGVAGGILPESAIVTGLPEGVVEKNQDAWLLSPSSLLDRSLGRRVHLRRTSAATGEVREHEAVVRSGAEGAVVLQTAEGFEALRCTGLNETIVYPSIPPGLSAKPTLSVRTRSARSGAATVTLSYLATGFDWQANYVATLDPSGERMDLFAWVTLANGDETSFVRANTQTIAGSPRREYRPRGRAPRGERLRLRCWPAGTTTSDLPHSMRAQPEEIVVTGSRIMSAAPPPPPPPPPPAVAMSAQQEDVGDLKLYRIPQPVTVAAKSQKQVAMLTRRGVKVRELFRSQVLGDGADPSVHSFRVIRTRNRDAEGLGLPLPAGQIVFFASGWARPILVGQGAVDDLAVGEDVEIGIGSATGLHARVERQGEDMVLTVLNDRARPADYEAEFPEAIRSEDKRLSRRNGRPLWAATIPANASTTFRYRLAEQR